MVKWSWGGCDLQSGLFLGPPRWQHLGLALATGLTERAADCKALTTPAASLTLLGLSHFGGTLHESQWIS